MVPQSGWPCSTVRLSAAPPSAGAVPHTLSRAVLLLFSVSQRERDAMLLASELGEV